MNDTNRTRRAWTQPIAAALTMTAIALATGGCASVQPEPPADWRVVDTARAATLDPGFDVYQQAATARPPRLQLIICYGPVVQTHAALRLEDGPDRVVYWDPGGDFGRNDPNFNRMRDVMTGPHATLERIWHYRRGECGNDAMLTYEFDLPQSEVRRLQNLLVYSSRNGGASGAFDTGTAPSQCSKNLCKFLQQELGARLDIPQRWLYPHDLGDHLWTQKPDRAVLFKENTRAVILVPPQTDPRTAAGGAPGDRIDPTAGH